MPGRKGAMSYHEIRDFAKELYPTAEVMSRRSTNTECIAFFPPTEPSGKVLIIARAGSNVKLKEKMEGDNFSPEHLNQGRLIKDVFPEKDIKTHCEKLGNTVIEVLRELRALQKRKPIIKYDEEGWAKKIKVGDIEFRLK